MKLSDRAYSVMQWADLHGDDLAGKLRLDPEDDAHTLEVLNEALLLAGECYYLASEAGQ